MQIRMNQFILALCGLPASGKSTLADAIQQALSFKVEIVRTDEWRDDAYYTEWKPEKEKPVRQKALARVRELVVDGKSIIHDDTNYYTSMRHELFEIAVANKCGFAIVYIATPVKVALEWNRNRGESPIPDKVIEDISQKFDYPGSRYLWDTADIEVSLEIQEIDNIVPEIVELLKRGAVGGGMAKDAIATFNVPEEAWRSAVDDAQPGHLVVILSPRWEETFRVLQDMASE